MLKQIHTVLPAADLGRARTYYRKMTGVRSVAFRELWRIPRTTKSIIITVYLDGSKQVQGSRIAGDDVDTEISSRGYEFVRILNRQTGTTRTPRGS